MEIRTLRYFLAVAREENMSRAAELLHVTQPTLSKALKSLEEELGKKLFTRRRRTLFWPRRVLADPIPCPGNSEIQKSVSRSSIPYHQR